MGGTKETPSTKKSWIKKTTEQNGIVQPGGGNGKVRDPSNAEKKSSKSAQNPINQPGNKKD